MGVAFQLSPGEPRIVPGRVWKHGFPTWLSRPAAILTLFSSQEPSLCWIQNNLYPLRWSGRPGQRRSSSPLTAPGPGSGKSPSWSGGVPRVPVARAPGRESERRRHSLVSVPGPPRASLRPEPHKSQTVRKPEAAAAGSWAAGGGGVSFLRMCSAGEDRKGRVSQLLVSEFFFFFFLSCLFRRKPYRAGSQAVPCSIFDSSRSCCS